MPDPDPQLWFADLYPNLPYFLSPLLEDYRIAKPFSGYIHGIYGDWCRGPQVEVL